MTDGPVARGGGLALGGVALDRALAALRATDPAARACWVYDGGSFTARSRRFVAAFAALEPLAAYALKANALHVLLARACDAGLGAEAGSVGELEAARAAGFAPARRILNGNARTPEEAAWVAREGAALVNADHVGELDLLEREAARLGSGVRVALRVNPGIDTPGHPYIATGGGDAKFGVSPAEALEAWAARARWPHLVVDGVHLHVGSQLMETGPLAEAARVALDLAAESARRGAPLALVNLGGGFGIDHDGAREFPLEAWAAELAAMPGARAFAWAFEPGRWMVATTGVLLAEVLWVKRRDGRRFVVLAAGMNDLIRPALYGARHRIAPVRPRPGAAEPACVVGPVCESADVFDEAAPLPPLEPGDLVAVLDAGAYGASMSSAYNGRGRLAELVADAGALTLARAAEGAADLASRDRDRPLGD
jgi:diaminopimelate decarboxylase